MMGATEEAKGRAYLTAKPFCLGFPSYYEQLLHEVEAIGEGIRTGELAYSGSVRTSRNRLIRDLVVIGLARRGNKKALAAASDLPLVKLQPAVLRGGG